MKLLIAIVQNYDSDRLLRAVTGAGFRATKISSMGGFLRMGNSTILMAMPADRVDEAKQLIGENCRSRVETKLDAETELLLEFFPVSVHDVPVGGAILFTIPVSRMVRIEPDGIRDIP